MLITKHNICETIEKYLKEHKIRYNILESDSRICFYELFVSSTEGNIQVEYNLDDDTDEIIYVQFFTKVDDHGLSLYNSEYNNESDESHDSIETEIEELVNAIKRINSGLSKIEAKINQIKDICEEYQLNFDEIIEVLYDFD